MSRNRKPELADEVLRLYGEGFSYNEIAENKQISLRTVKNYLNWWVTAGGYKSLPQAYADRIFPFLFYHRLHGETAFIKVCDDNKV